MVIRYIINNIVSENLKVLDKQMEAATYPGNMCTR